MRPRNPYDITHKGWSKNNRPGDRSKRNSNETKTKEKNGFKSALVSLQLQSQSIRVCGDDNPIRGNRNLYCHRVEGEVGGLTSSRCLTRFTKLLPSAANPLTARIALDVLRRSELSDRWKIDVDVVWEMVKEKKISRRQRQERFDQHPIPDLPLTRTRPPQVNQSKFGGPYLQGKDLFLVPALNRVSFRLTGITCDDGEIFTGDGEDGTSVGRVGVEAAAMTSRGQRAGLADRDGWTILLLNGHGCCICLGRVLSMSLCE